MQQKGLNILSIFDGMSCGQIALERAGIKVDNYYASEIDPYAIKITMKNYPKTIQLGSITEWQKWDIPKPDIVMGGSPCQGFSFAGKGLNFDDPRSKLFLVFHDILKHYKPEQFLLENVIMSAQSNDVISSMLGDLYPECIEQGQLFKAGRLEPIMINSALVSAQNRERLYWTNIQGITQPEDKGILLRDIIEDGEVDRQKDFCLDANYYKGGSEKNYKEKKRRQLVMSQSENRLMVRGGAFRGHNKENPSDRTPGIDTEQRLEINTTGKQNTLTKVGKDTVVVYGCQQVGEAGLKGKESINRVYGIDAKGPTLTAICGGHQEPKISEDNITWRKLTVTECERLQTVPDGYTDGVSNTRRYHALGNGWTVEVIKHIFSFLPEEYKKRYPTSA